MRWFGVAGTPGAGRSCSTPSSQLALRPSRVLAVEARLEAVAFAGVVALLLPGPADAQLANPSPAALGMAQNYSAIASGYAALAWNPAGLALRGSPGFSVAILPVSAGARTDPLSFGDIVPYADEFVPADVRTEWLERIIENGGLRGAGDVDLTYIAMNMGRFGLQVGTRARGGIALKPDIAELILFGNAGRTGEARNFVFGGSSMDLSVTSTAAIGYAHPIEVAFGRLPMQRLSIGATLKYTIGHALLTAEDRGGRLKISPLALSIEFPLAYTDPNAGGLDRGHGVGLDLGAAWEGGPLRIAAVLHNVFNTFRWDESQLVYRPGRALLNDQTALSDLETRPFAEAPDAVRASVEGLRYEPAATIAAAARPDDALLLTAELRRRFGGGLDSRPRTHMGIAAEFRPTPSLPVRAGVALVSGGAELASGVGFELGGLELAGSVAYRSSDFGSGVIGMVGLSLRGR